MNEVVIVVVLTVTVTVASSPVFFSNSSTGRGYFGAAVQF